ncbi:methyltransferase domain-containing protein [Tychonema sp. LEGE 07199]|uniref:protein-L-isoaspartate O-methyltransferase family protein n=1 Tax=unclassified Tychonema TaxID=2642144 RepID=UPI001882D70C|nr:MULTISPECIES: methyltransferase domain-containing protein [unclassified Tychonema]MBE9120191.1 methyltransferase domain-containing protein [Tychonema sp. LEGE 07199]MBE9133041.1 methyltransferase domain-containing protein [Tychonema sp. LEGE 07196]
MSDKVDYALTDIVMDAYVLKPDGYPIPQSSSPTVIAAALRLLQVPPGARVLEVGTGSGYSTALLAHLVGSDGFVVSLDVDSNLVKRASSLLTKNNLANVKVVVADGRSGCSTEAPFDRIIVWATADIIPHTWIEQLSPGGLIVAPVRLRQLAATTAIARVRLDTNKNPIGERVIPGGFVPLTDKPLTHWYGPAQDADIKAEIKIENAEMETDVIWASAEWLRQEQQIGEAEQILELMQVASRQEGPLYPDEDVEALRAYLLATYPEGFTTAYTQNLGPAIGCSQPGSLAMLSLCGEGYAAAGERDAAVKLSDWISSWRASGRSGFEQLRPVLKYVQCGYQVGVTL